jgi:hypothetical protein
MRLLAGFFHALTLGLETLQLGSSLFKVAINVR